MNKFDQVYNKIISEWKIFSNDKTKLKSPWDESDELLSVQERIEKYVDSSDTNWKWDDSLSKFENILKLYEELENDPPYSHRVVFIVDLLSSNERTKLQEIYNDKQETNMINKLEQKIF